MERHGLALGNGTGEGTGHGGGTHGLALIIAAA